jgi:hypothetical protein
MITKELTDISGLSNEALLMNVKQIVRRRRASFFENKFRDSLFGALRIETDAPLFKLTAKTIAKILIERYKAPDWDTTKAVTLFQDDAAIIQKQIGTKKLDSPFILFKEHPLTLREALRYLPFKPIELKHPTNKKISTILQDFFRYVIEQEVLYREALKRGISDNQNVTERANLWKENLLASLYSAKIWKTVNDEAEKAGEPVYYDVVSVKSIATLLDLLRQMKNGQPFDSIYANNKGFAIPDDSPLFTPKVKELLDGQMKAPLHSNPPGVYGPFESGGNYILLQKRSPKKLMPERISSAPGIRRQQLQHKYEEKMEGITAKLFSKYAVSVNSEVFEKITINGLNTFTVQYLGFGNKLPAFPMTAPYSQWIKRLPAGQLP